MLVLLFVIFVGLFILGSVFIDVRYHDIFRGIVQVLTVIGAAICICIIPFVCIDYSQSKVVDKKISMYMEENKNIENQIDTIVSNYMDYENKTFTELKGNDAIAVVSLYPDLQSDELVKTQIATYQANNAKLKELKEQKIESSIYKWWLFFGK